MHASIRFIFKLTSQKPAMSFGEFFRLCDHAASLQGGGGKNYFGAKKTHEFAALHAEALRHHNY